MVRSRSRTRGPAGWLLLAMLVILVDQLTKAIVVREFALGERLVLIPDLFDLTLTYNKGAAFSLLANADGWQRWLFIALGLGAGVFIMSLLARHAGQALFALALALILGGAIGNVIDRIIRGQVVDFLLAYHGHWFFPAFNLADSAITLGAALLILDELLRVRRGR
jgi:signal peptidase II